MTIIMFSATILIAIAIAAAGCIWTCYDGPRTYRIIRTFPSDNPYTIEYKRKWMPFWERIGDVNYDFGPFCGSTSTTFTTARFPTLDDAKNRIEKDISDRRIVKNYNAPIRTVLDYSIEE